MQHVGAKTTCKEDRRCLLRSSPPAKLLPASRVPNPEGAGSGPTCNSQPFEQGPARPSPSRLTLLFQQVSHGSALRRKLRGSGCTACGFS